VINNVVFFSPYPLKFFFVILQAFGGDDSDVGSSSSNHNKTENGNLNAVPDTPPTEDQNKQRKGSENPVDDNDPSNLLPSTESYRSMGEILSSMDPGNHLPIPVVESGSGKQTGKASSASFSSKRSTFWGRSNVSFYFLTIYSLTNLSEI